MASQIANPFEMRFARVPAEPGLYWLWSERTRLYVGETLNLRERLEVQFAKTIGFDFWGKARDKLKLSLRTVADRATRSLGKHQSRWIADWGPIGNYQKLATRR